VALHPRTLPFAGRVFFVVLAFLTLAGCGRETGSDSPAELEFEVIPDYLGEPYETAGIEFRPPFGWLPLDDSQREQVAEALIQEQSEDRFNLEIIEIFLHTETLSFVALSAIARDGSRIAEKDEYIESFEAALGPTADDNLRARGTFLLNGMEVTQLRYLRNGRVSFTLIFSSPNEDVMQLDYSIPAAAYEDEGIKLESSIGTLQTHNREDS
jgi:hypothetical protein